MAGTTASSQDQSFLKGSASLVVWGDVDSTQVDEPSLNDWWTNEHLPERLSIPGFLRARRYYTRDDATNHTKYLTLYEVSELKTLTSQAYMEKLNNPTPGTEKHIPTLATMQRSVCLGATMAMFVLSLPPNDETSRALKDIVSSAFSDLQRSNKSVMAFNILQEDRAATEPGSSSQSYLNVKLKPTNQDDVVKWIVLLEFSTTVRQPLGGIQKSLEKMTNQLLRLPSLHGSLLGLIPGIYEFMCSVRL